MICRGVTCDDDDDDDEDEDDDDGRRCRVTAVVAGDKVEVILLLLRVLVAGRIAVERSSWVCAELE